MKKGFSLIEVLVALAIGAILISMQLQGTAHAIKTFNLNRKNVQESLYLYECFSFIEQKIKESITVSAIGDEIRVYSIETTGVREINNTKVIKKSFDKLIIVYYENGIYKGENTIVKNIKDFKVEIKENLLYIKITSVNGVEQKKCLGVSVKK